MAATLPTDGGGSLLGTSATTITQETLATKRTSSRKQWSSIQGGPRGLLRRMRSQLAEDGCPESQLVMGRTLLEQLNNENGEGEGEGEEGARLAVFWLTRASLQGSAEATTLLTHCLNNNIGICEHNYHEVRECLAMDLQEKLARRSAHMLFHSLSDGNEAISSTSLATKVTQILSGEQEEDEASEEDSETKEEKSEDDKNTSNSSLEKLYGGERFTEEHLVSGAVMYCQGRLPPLHHFLAPHAPVTTPSIVVKVVRIPVRILAAVYQGSVQFLGITLTTKAGRVWGAVNPITAGLLVCLLAALVSLFGGTEAAGVILPAVLSLSAFMVMLASTARILLNRRRFDSFCTWSSVFSHFCPELDTDQAEGRFRSHCRMPYLTVLISVLVYLATVPLTSLGLLVVCLPVMITCAILTFILVPERLCLWQFLSLGLYITAVTPGIRKYAGGYIPEMVQALGLERFIVEGEYEIWGKVTMHLGVGPVLHLVWGALQVSVAVICGPNRLPPHLLSLMWWQLGVLAIQKVTTPVDVLYPLAGWCLVAVFPAASSLVLILGPAVICAGVSLYVSLSYQALLVLFLSSSLVLWASRNWWPTLVLIFKLVLLSGVVVMLLQPSVFVRNTSLKYSTLDWANFKNVCLPNKDAEAAVIHGCSPLAGTVIRWQGTVTQVSIVRVRNIPKTALSYLPEALEKPLRCYLGRRLPACQNVKELTPENERCLLLHSVLGLDTCTLDNWNQYTFEIRISMTPSYWQFGVTQGPDVVISADDTFRNYLLKLSIGDQVEFLASLSDGLGTQTLNLDLTAMRCVTCKGKMGFIQRQDPPTATNLHTAPIFVFNFLLGPTLTM